MSEITEENTGSDAKEHCSVFTKTVNGKTYICYKRYKVKHNNPGRPKKTDRQKIESEIKILQKKLESIKPQPIQ
jgi:hypothetical protein